MNMTPTTTEREAVIAEMREEAAVQIKTVWIDRATFDRWIAALTREQREGVVTFAVDDVRFDVPASIAEKVAAKLAPADNLPQPETPGAVAQKNPFFMQIEAFNAWHDETYPSPCDAKQRGLWQGRRSQRYATWNAAIAWFKTTQPAPVDVRLREAAAALCDSLEAGTDSRAHYQAVRALLDGQPAGVDAKNAEVLAHGRAFLDTLPHGHEQAVFACEVRAKARADLAEQAALGDGGGRDD